MQQAGRKRRTKMLKCKAEMPYRSFYTYEKFPGKYYCHETWNCPRCRHVLNAGPNFQPNYCDNCGQKLDFNHVEFEEDMPKLVDDDIKK